MTDQSVAMGSVLLRNMPEASARTLLKIAQSGRLNAQEVLFREGDPAVNVYVVLAGQLKLSRIDGQGNEAVVAIQRPGDSIATALAFSPNEYPVTCTALTDSRYLAFGCETIRATLMQSQETIGAVLAATYKHLHELVDQVAQLKASSARKRVARFLVALCDGPTGSATVQLPYDKVVIAGVLGMTPETLSRSFNRLKEHGVRVDATRVTIDDIENLIRFLDSE
ncbi:Crp/Fnr family transcriptional regulator [Roseobacter sp. EG26]|uniref:Crp/Fnr family transcriptional regulator n=1 Tax=Roseobacter sp. EG26 TaxID=3412477 RepID=UPI003CE46659